MRILAVALAAAFAVGGICTAEAQSNPNRQPANQAAKRRAPPSEYVPGTVVVHRGEDGRTRTKVLVQKRSYLDGGTEVMPGDNINAYRSTFMTHRPVSDALGPNDITNPPGPIPTRDFLPGKDNPWPGFQF